MCIYYVMTVYRDHTAEREKAEQQRISTERKLSELFRLLMLDSQYRDIHDLASSLEHVANKVDITL